MVNKIVWGCDPSLQYESAWIRSLTNASESHDINPSLYDSLILVESGLLRLNKNIQPETLDYSDGVRKERLSYFVSSNFPKKTLIHLSDEEGLDGDSGYNQLSPHIRIFRNFNHTRFDSNSCIYNFPIGPRDVFLDIPFDSIKTSSIRRYPWSFMGTVWKSSSF